MKRLIDEIRSSQSEEQLNEAAFEKWVDALGALISKASNTPEYGKASQALEDWGNKYPRDFKKFDNAPGLFGEIAVAIVEGLDARVGAERRAVRLARRVGEGE